MKNPVIIRHLSALILLTSPFAQAGENPWVPLFNGKNLDGWTAKICGHPSGENFAATFRVVDGMIQASYEGYEKFNGQFGHLFTDIAYSHYILRLEYRFAGRHLIIRDAEANIIVDVLPDVLPAPKRART